MNILTKRNSLENLDKIKVDTIKWNEVYQQTLLKKKNINKEEEEEEETHHKLSENLRVITWNVWFDSFYRIERYDAMILIILNHNPDVVCLQEIIPKFAIAIRSSKILNSIYKISNNHINNYGCIMLIKHKLKPIFHEIRFKHSRMGRSLLIGELMKGENDQNNNSNDDDNNEEDIHYQKCFQNCAIGTVHLESLNSAPIRKLQLDTCNKELEKYNNTILCGDFNFDDVQDWGDWRKKIKFQKQLKNAKSQEEVNLIHQVMEAQKNIPIENHVLLQTIPNYIDLWCELRQSSNSRQSISNKEDRGATFDGVTNPTCVFDCNEVMRYDRIMLKKQEVQSNNHTSLKAEEEEEDGHSVTSLTSKSSLWLGKSITMIGTENIVLDDDDSAADIAELNLKPSDHYGLQCDITVVPSPNV